MWHDVPESSDAPLPWEGAWPVVSSRGGYTSRQSGLLAPGPAQGGQVVGVRYMDDAHVHTDAIYEERMRRAAFLQAKAITEAAAQSNPRGLPASGVVMDAFPEAAPDHDARPSTGGVKMLNPQWEHVLRYGYRGVHPDNNAVLAQDWQARSRDNLMVAPLTARDNLMSLVMRATSSPGQTHSPHLKPLGRRVAEHLESPFFAEDTVSAVERDYVFSSPSVRR